ncbi:MAG: CRISPR-associated endonuclease Cas3'' [Kiritimatiellia bacterium]
MDKEKKYFAHSLEGRPKEEWQPLEKHLENVAELAADFAKPFGGEEWARLAGLWHDLGKYAPAFQRKLEGESIRVVHSEAGGHLSSVKGWRGVDCVLSWLIMGHHAGLADYSTDQTGAKALAPKMREPHRSDFIFESVPDVIFNQPIPSMPTMYANQEQFPDQAFFIRMLYSCLVDADFLDTESFMDSTKGAKRAGDVSIIEELLNSFDEHMLQFSNTTGLVNECRALVLSQCRAAASQQGVFSLTVPTGGGKTLASLAFALRHAVTYKKRRIVYVIPYTSIIEQTAEVFRSIPGFSHAVLEHHSNLVWDGECEDEQLTKRLAMENWDAPVIVTTSVQFFESLYANKSSRCRKLHNLTDSVVVFDEAQCLPPAFLRPCVFAIRELSRHYGVTPVLCTATQPVLDKKESFDFVFKEGFKNVTEIITEPDELFYKLSRVRVECLYDLEPTELVDLAGKLMEEDQSLLCIVNRKADARELAGLLPEDQVIHLSTNMCAAHRLEVFANIKRRLGDGERILTISTSLVEAGVDLDFPIVYRALAGLDSIAQAAGRCNREGKLNYGRTVIFMPEEQPDYVKPAASIAVDYLRPDRLDCIFLPKTFSKYFNEYFFMKGTKALDDQGILELLPPETEEICFQTAAEKFRLIDSDWQISIVVPYGESGELIDRLVDERWNAKKLCRKLQCFTVNIPRNAFTTLLEGDYIHEVQGFEGLYSLHTKQLYDERFGFVTPDNIDCFGWEDLIT